MIVRQNSNVKGRGLFLLALILSISFVPAKTEPLDAHAGASFSVQINSLKQPIALEKINIEAGVKAAVKFSFSPLREVNLEDSFAVCRKACPVLITRHYLRDPFYIIRRSNAP